MTAGSILRGPHSCALLSSPGSRPASGWRNPRSWVEFPRSPHPQGLMVSPCPSHYDSICSWLGPRSVGACLPALPSVLFPFQRSDPVAWRKGPWARWLSLFSAPRLGLPIWFWGLCHLISHHPFQHNCPSAVLWVSDSHHFDTGIHSGLCPMKSQVTLKSLEIFPECWPAAPAPPVNAALLGCFLISRLCLGQAGG